MKIQFGMNVFLLSAVFLLAGCVTPASYTDPIIKYQKASTIVIESARTQYTLANKKSRDALIDQLTAKNERITFKSIEQSKLISADALQVRMDALDTLAKHGELLLALASNDSADKAVTSARKLSTAVSSLKGAVNESQGVNGSRATENLAGPFAELAGKIASMVIEQKINAELKSAINQSNKKVDALIDSIEEDMRNLYAAQRSDLVIARQVSVDDYNCQSEGAACKDDNGKPIKVSKYPASERKKTASEVKAVEDKWDAFITTNPAPGFNAMRDAHSQLVTYANSSKSPQDFAQLTEAMDVFVSRAVMISESIETIRNAQEEGK
ncbi:hypothetical protein [Pseudomonas sp. PDM19]|uniref:hypothetical protein n=1 Tax=Pseudomonas sp. PDM19 TaxID=2769272 RepID=UPI001785BC53|nr:hypothetical protein [Pseudomonas sp. PDM19]MBD9630647.1 hypothetical protein [Pseudomonas sp. PDM19]